LNNELEDAIRRICYLKEQAIINAMSAYRPRQESRYSYHRLQYLLLQCTRPINVLFSHLSPYNARTYTTLVSSKIVFVVSRNFFEMVRFDFVVNEDLRIFLMEVWHAQFRCLTFYIHYILLLSIFFVCYLCLQCFDAVGWAARRASGL